MPKKSLQLISLPKSLKNKKKKNIKSSITKNKKKSNSRKKNIGGTKKKTLRKKIGGMKRKYQPPPPPELPTYNSIPDEENGQVQEKNRMNWIQLLKRIIQEITKEQIPFDYIPSTTIKEFIKEFFDKNLEPLDVLNISPVRKGIAFEKEHPWYSKRQYNIDGNKKYRFLFSYQDIDSKRRFKTQVLDFKKSLIKIENEHLVGIEGLQERISSLKQKIEEKKEELLSIIINNGANLFHFCSKNLITEELEPSTTEVIPEDILNNFWSCLEESRNLHPTQGLYRDSELGEIHTEALVDYYRLSRQSSLGTSNDEKLITLLNKFDVFIAGYREFIRTFEQYFPNLKKVIDVENTDGSKNIYIKFEYPLSDNYKLIITFSSHLFDMTRDNKFHLHFSLLRLNLPRHQKKFIIVPLRVDSEDIIKLVLKNGPIKIVPLTEDGQQYFRVILLNILDKNYNFGNIIDYSIYDLQLLIKKLSLILINGVNTILNLQNPMLNSEYIPNLKHIKSYIDKESEMCFLLESELERIKSLLPERPSYDIPNYLYNFDRGMCLRALYVKNVNLRQEISNLTSEIHSAKRLKT